MDKTSDHAQMGNRRTSSQVSVDAHVSRRSTQTLAFAVRYVLLRLGVTILLGHSKVHDVDNYDESAPEL